MPEQAQPENEATFTNPLSNEPTAETASAQQSATERLAGDIKAEYEDLAQDAEAMGNVGHASFLRDTAANNMAKHGVMEFERNHRNIAHDTANSMKPFLDKADAYEQAGNTYLANLAKEAAESVARFQEADSIATNKQEQANTYGHPERVPDSLADK